MLDYTKSNELMLAKEAEYMKSIQEIPSLNAGVLALMSDLYRSGWRDCWMEEAKARLTILVDVSPTNKEGIVDDVR